MASGPEGGVQLAKREREEQRLTNGSGCKVGQAWQRLNAQSRPSDRHERWGFNIKKGGFGDGSLGSGPSVVS